MRQLRVFPVFLAVYCGTVLFLVLSPMRRHIPIAPEQWQEDHQPRALDTQNASNTQHRNPRPLCTQRNKTDHQVRVCSQAERYEHIRKTCNTKGLTLDAWLHRMSDKELRAMVSDWLTDEKHQVLACLHFKVSTATWDVILCNNSRTHPLPANHKMDWTKWKQCLPENNVFKLRDPRFSKEDIIKRIKSYYKFMVVRHPFDRLLSVYFDKLRDTNRYYLPRLGAKILRQYRSWLPEAAKKKGKGVYFQEFIQNILDGDFDNHWKTPYSDQCQPCFVDYDAIVKLETFNTDIPPIIAHLEGRSQNAAENSFSKSKWNERFVKLLAQYGNITGRQLDGLSRMYQLDLKQFGYGHEWRNDSLAISCQMKTASGETCC